MLVSHRLSSYANNTLAMTEDFFFPERKLNVGVLSSPLRRDRCEDSVDISQMAHAAVTFHPGLLRHEAAICWRHGSRASLNFPTTHIWSLMKGLANTLAALFINKCFFWTHSCWNNRNGCVRGDLQNVFMIYQRFHSTVRLFFLISFSQWLAYHTVWSHSFPWQ